MGTRVNGVDLDAGTSVALSDATPAALGTASPGVSTEASRADHVHEAPAGGAPGAVIAEPMTGTGWTTTQGGSVTATWASSKLTLSAPTGATHLTLVERDATPLDARATQWEACIRVQVTAGDNTSPRGQLILRWQESAGNAFSAVLTSQRQIGCTSDASGSATDHGFVSGPSAGQITGGQLWIRLTRLHDGRIAVWWGVGTSGALPTAWTRTHLVDRAALTLAVSSQAKIRFVYGWFGEGGIGTTWTVDVLAIRTSWSGQL